jgi:hypothetical protein
MTAPARSPGKYSPGRSGGERPAPGELLVKLGIEERPHGRSNGGERTEDEPGQLGEKTASPSATQACLSTG